MNQNQSGMFDAFSNQQANGGDNENSGEAKEAGATPTNNDMNPMIAMQNAMQAAMQGGMPNFNNMMGKIPQCYQNSAGRGLHITPGMNMNMMNPAMMSQMQQMMFGMGMGGMNGMNNMNGMNMNAMMGNIGFDNGFGGWPMSPGGGNMNMNGDYGNNGYYQGQRQGRGHFARGASNNRYRNDTFSKGRARGQFNSQRGYGRDLGRRISYGQASGYAADQEQTRHVAQEDYQRRRGSSSYGDTGRESESQRPGAISEDVVQLTSERKLVTPAKKPDDVHEDRVALHDVDSSIQAGHNESSNLHPNDPEPTQQSPEIKYPSNNKRNSRDELTEQAPREEAISPTDHRRPANEEDRAPSIPQGPAAQYAVHESSIRGRANTRGVGRGTWAPRGRGAGFSSVSITSPTEPKGVGVVGAPKGPKALREGLPNVGFRGRGTSVSISRGHGRAASFTSRNGLTSNSVV